MSECPFKHSVDVQCIHGKRYKRVNEMPETLLDDDLPEVNLIFLGECFRCVKVTINNKSAWKYELDKHSHFWSV